MIISYTVESMQERDLIEVVEIEETTGLNRWGYDAYRRELFKNPNSVMLVARDLISGSPEPKILGFFAGWMVADELHINNIACRRASRRRGIGRSLMEAAIEEGRFRGVRFILLEVRASNQPAQSLYRNLGFHYIGRRRDYYRSPVEDALVMKLDL
jgi:ribosomal-protein-alanine N-acetyltransferase